MLFIDFKFPLLKYLLDSSSCTDFKSSIVEVKQCVGYRSWYVHIKAKHSCPALSRMWLDTVFIADRGTKYCTLMDAMPVKASPLLLSHLLSHTFCAFHTRFSFLEWFQWIDKIKKKPCFLPEEFSQTITGKEIAFDRWQFSCKYATEIEVLFCVIFCALFELYMTIIRQ